MTEPVADKDDKSWYVYILKCSDNTLYTGVTNDIDNRLFQHNHGTTGAKYTRARRPVNLVYAEACDDKIAAMKREYAVKKLSRASKLLLIAENN